MILSLPTVPVLVNVVLEKYSVWVLEDLTGELEKQGSTPEEAREKVDSIFSKVEILTGELFRVSLARSSAPQAALADLSARRYVMEPCQAPSHCMLFPPPQSGSASVKTLLSNHLILFITIHRVLNWD